MTTPERRSLLERAVVQVLLDETPRGTGFFVRSADGAATVLTCSHVLPKDLPDPSRLRVAPLAGDWKPQPIREVRQRDRERDLALLVLGDDHDWPPIQPLVLVKERQPGSGSRFQAVGFPLERGKGQPERWDWVRGEILGSGGEHLRQIDQDGSRRIRKGFSGAPVWSTAEGGVIGLIRLAGTDGVDSGAFVVPSESIHDAFGVPLRETRPLQRLLSSTTSGPRPLPRRHPSRAVEALSSGQLLTAAHEIVPFTGRDQELGVLAAWRDEPSTASAWLWWGDGGAGKTRLAIETCHRWSVDGWITGFLPDEAEPPLDLLFDGPEPRLVVVDYAEARPHLVEKILERANSHDGAPLRLLLLSRREGWLRSLLPDNQAVQALLFRSPQERAIEPLVHQPDDRPRVFLAAAAAFAETLRQQNDTVATTEPAELLANVPHLTDPGTGEYARVLYLHMAALAAVQGDRVDSPRDALDLTRQHERRFWRRAAERETSSSGEQNLLTADLERTMAAVTLVQGTRSPDETDDLLNRLALTDRLYRHKVLELVQRLYGGASEPAAAHPTEAPAGRHQRHLDPVTPDPLGEELVAHVFLGDPTLLPPLLDDVAPDVAERMLTTLDRLAQRDPERGMALLHATLEDRLGQLAEPALAIVSTGSQPLVRALEEKVAVLPEAEREVAQTIANICDRYENQRRVSLQGIAEAATRRLLDLLPPLEEEPSAKHRTQHARRLNNLGNRLADLGRCEDALKATQQAVDIYRQLANPHTGRPDAFLPDLAMSLNNLGLRLADLGHREDALEAAQQAVEIYQKLPEPHTGRPDKFLPHVAGSLHNLGARLADLGRREEALEATQKAVDIRKQLADPDTGRDAFLPDLATSFHNLGFILANLGRREDALEATQQAVDIYQKLADPHTGRPDAFLPWLAGSLDNLGSRLADLGHHEDALQATRKAANIYEQLTDPRTGRPEAFLPNLAMSFNNLSTMLADLGHPESALEAAQKAVDIYQKLADPHTGRPDAFRPDLARSLMVQCRILRALERMEEAITSVEEAIQLLTPLFIRIPEAFRNQMINTAREYIKTAERASQEPSSDLLRPIDKKMQELGWIPSEDTPSDPPPDTTS